MGRFKRINGLKQTKIMANITVQELKERMDKGEQLTIIDVRETYEFEEGNIPGATNIPLALVPLKLEDLEQYRNEELIMQCRSGARSAAATQVLMSNGFTNVRNLEGGILAWNALNNA
jgi:rhodanese-related sulfurtransferase